MEPTTAAPTIGQHMSSSALQDVYSAECIHFIWQLIHHLIYLLINVCWYTTSLHAFWWTLQPHIQLRHKSFVIITTIALTTSNGITNICIFISTGSSGSLEPTLTSNAFHSYVWKTLPCHLTSLLHLRTLLSLLLNTCYIMPSILCLKIFFMQ